MNASISFRIPRSCASSCELMLQLTERLVRAAVGSLSATWLRSQCCRSIASRANTMQGKKSLASYSIHLTCHINAISAGDRVLLQAKGKGVFLTKKLNPESTTTFQTGSVKHSEVIGKRTRDTVKSSKGHEIRAYLPSLAEYTTLTPRVVTPVGLHSYCRIRIGSSHASVDISR